MLNPALGAAQNPDSGSPSQDWSHRCGDTCQLEPKLLLCSLSKTGVPQDLTMYRIQSCLCVVVQPLSLKPCHLPPFQSWASAALCPASWVLSDSFDLLPLGHAAIAVYPTALVLNWDYVAAAVPSLGPSSCCSVPHPSVLNWDTSVPC